MGVNDRICNYSFGGKEFAVDADKCEIIQSNIYTTDFSEVKDCSEGLEITTGDKLWSCIAEDVKGVFPGHYNIRNGLCNYGVNGREFATGDFNKYFFVNNC